MTFAWPQLFWLLLAPAALLAWDLTHRRRAGGVSHPKILQAEAGARSLTLSSFAHAVGPARQAMPRIWLCLGLAAAVVALTRPQWGRLEEPVFDQSREILLAVDLSRSMLVTDIRPSRLDRAKLLIQSLLEKLAGERVGLVVFSGTSFLQSPLSADYEILREFLPALGPDFLPEGGSNYGPLLTTSLEAFSSTSSADRFLIVMSDGEATDDDWKSRIDELKKKGIRVIGLGVGTAAGAMIPDGAGGFVKDERGAVVLSKLESGTLQELARSTNGTYRDASTWIDLAGLVQETIAAGRKGKFVEKNTVRLVERFQWPLAFALWCLLVSFYYEFPVRPRVRDFKTGNRKPAAAEPMAGRPETGNAKTGMVATAAALVLLVSGLRFPVSGFAAATMANPAQPKAAAPAAPTPPPELSALGKIVGRLANSPKPSARDWADVGRETVSWGSRLKSEQHPVPEGPVRDALTAVDLGSKQDPKTTDWPKLRQELQDLLNKPEDQQQDKNQDQQDKDQQNQDQKKQDQQKQDSSQKDQSKSGQPQDQKDSQQKQDPAQDQNAKQDEKKQQGESAFGDMKQKQDTPPPPPPPANDTQKVGGEKENTPKEPVDPALALPLQKLDQLRNQDSPAHLFQLMEGDRKPTKKPGKDW